MLACVLCMRSERQRVGKVQSSIPTTAYLSRILLLLLAVLRDLLDDCSNGGPMLLCITVPAEVAAPILHRRYSIFD